MLAVLSEPDKAHHSHNIDFKLLLMFSLPPVRATQAMSGVLPGMETCMPLWLAQDALTPCSRMDTSTCLYRILITWVLRWISTF